MEFWKPSFINTTTMLVVNSNTGTAENVMIPDVTYQYISSGLSTDGTIASMRINFAQTTTIDRLAIFTNSKQFRIFYNGLTASTLALLSGATTVSNWTNNSEGAMALNFTPVACTSLSIDMYSTQVSNAEKVISYLVVSESRYDFSRIPAAKGYRPILDGMEVEHRLSTGDTRVQTLSSKWEFEVELNYITETQRNELKEVYDLHDGHIFVPFPTTTSWDRVIAPVVWPKPFRFFSYSDNAPSAGFEGSMRLLETTP